MEGYLDIFGSLAMSTYDMDFDGFMDDTGRIDDYA
jgi:hypothetical protein